MVVVAAVAGRSLPRRLHRQASSIVVGGGKALGLSAGIAIVALNRVRILLDKRFGIHAGLDAAAMTMMMAVMTTRMTTIIRRATCRCWPRCSGTA